jgi:hypothetical protein
MSWILDEVPAATVDKVVEEKSTTVASEKENKENKENKGNKVDNAITEEKSSDPIEEMKENAVEGEKKVAETKKGEQEEQTVHRPAHTLNNINFKIKKGKIRSTLSPFITHHIPIIGNGASHSIITTNQPFSLSLSPSMSM